MYGPLPPNLLYLNTILNTQIPIMHVSSGIGFAQYPIAPWCTWWSAQMSLVPGLMLMPFVIWASRAWKWYFLWSLSWYQGRIDLWSINAHQPSGKEFLIHFYLFVFDNFSLERTSIDMWGLLPILFVQMVWFSLPILPDIWSWSSNENLPLFCKFQLILELRKVHDPCLYLNVWDSDTWGKSLVIMPDFFL